MHTGKYPVNTTWRSSGNVGHECLGNALRAHIRIGGCFMGRLVGQPRTSPPPLVGLVVRPTSLSVRPTFLPKKTNFLTLEKKSC